MNQSIKHTKSFNATLYFISMTIAFTTRYGDYYLGFYLQIIIGAMWIMVAVIQMAENKFRFHHKKDILFFVKLYMFPHLVIHLYTIILMITGKVKWEYFTTNVTVYIPTLFAIFSVYLFEEKALKYIIAAMIASWVLSVSVSTLLKGFAIFPHAILQAYINPLDHYGGLSINYLELHDLVLAAGYIIVYYFFSKEKLTKRNLMILFSIVFIMTLGMKRISVLGLVVAILFCIVIKFTGTKKGVKICNFTGWIGFILCYLFIYILSIKDVFYNFLTKYNINSMGRIYYYYEVMKYATFSPGFTGIGRNMVTQLLNTELSYLKVGGVHSDIIKMYVENGFFLFGLWLWYYLIHITKSYNKKYGNQVAVLYFGLVIFMFSLFMTDNIEIYFICQIISIILPVSYAIYYK